MLKVFAALQMSLQTHLFEVSATWIVSEKFSDRVAALSWFISVCKTRNLLQEKEK